MSGPLREGALERLWWRERPTWADRALLLPLLLPEALFRAAAAVRGGLYRGGALPVARAAVPVISVGNLAVGGAGKTPVALALAERLRGMGRRPALLSRGYGSTGQGPRVVSDGTALLLPADRGGDEPVLAARRLPSMPVLVGPDRADLARLAVESLGADVLLLDDGFQHRRLARDLDVVVLDASNPWGNGHCLPRGPNREPPSALARAGLLWLTHVDRAGEASLAALRDLALRRTGLAPVESRHAPRDLADGALSRSFPLAGLRGARVGLLTGVARPAGVRRTVEGLGAEVAVARPFPDHHRFTPAEVEECLAAAGAAGASTVVTTEKDAVRLPPPYPADARLRVLRIDAEVLAGEASLREALARALGSGAAGAGRGMA